MNRFLLKNIKRQSILVALREMNYSNLEMYDLKTFKKQHLTNKKNSIEVISKLCNIPREKSSLAIKQNPNLSKLSQISMEKKFTICLHYFNDQFIKENLNILSCSNLEKKLKQLRKANLNPKIYYPLLNLNDYVFDNIINIIISNNNQHVNVLCKILQISEKEIISEIADHPFVFRLPVTKITEILKLFKEYNMDSRSILSDIWSIRYNIKRSKTRLEILSQLNIPKIMPWMTRCSENIFEGFVSRKEAFNEVIKNEESIEEYFARRLNCSKESAIEFKKLIKLSNTSLHKIDEFLNFLFENGFTETEILCTPRIFQHKIDKIKNRISELQNLGYKPSSLLIFCCTQKQYNSLVEKLKSK